MPGDVDIALKTQLENAKKFSEVQREFDLYSWQMFLALNWPTNSQGQAAPKLTDTRFGQPHWTLWHNSSSIFQTDGARPAACGLSPKARTLVLFRGDLAKPVSKGLAPFSAQATANADPRATRFLGVLSAVGELNAGQSRRRHRPGLLWPDDRSERRVRLLRDHDRPQRGRLSLRQ
jgi:hypothetical protein